MFEVSPASQLPQRSVLPTMPTSKRFAVVVSDVHIGNGAPTCWYQASMHEPRLTALLRWIVAQREQIREVVLLGDLFDVWTYPPHMRPPSMADIIAANPRLLGPQGPLAAVVKAFPGKVRMLLGNHDLTLTQADVDTLNRSLGGNVAQGEQIQLITAPAYVVTGLSGARTVFSHGHLWTMFNAPDPRARQWNSIPIGHFVSRAIAFQLSSRRQTAVNMPDHGNPSGGLDVGAFVRAYQQNSDLGDLLLSYMCRITRMPETQRIVMPNGQSATVRDAKPVYRGLRALWAAREGRDLDGLRAAKADWKGDDLAWFAQRLAMRTNSDLVVMGHTHKAVGGLGVSPVNYVNSGYLCVAGPDRGKEMTFVQVDLERASAQVLSVGASGAISGARAPVFPSVILSPFMDFSCYARIDNRSDRPLRLVRFSGESATYFAVRPPQEIAPRSRGHIWLQDMPGVRGSAGRFIYTDGTRTLEFVVECPTGVLSNVVRSPVTGYLTKTANRAWRSGGVDRTGHPLQVRFVVEARRPAAGIRVPPSAPAPAPARPRVLTA